MTLDNKSYLYLRDCLGNIAEELQPTFTEAERSAVFEFIDVGEYGLAFDSLSSNSKCNTLRPDGLRCCHANKILQTHEC